MPLAAVQLVDIALITDRQKAESVRYFMRQLRQLQYAPHIITAISPQSVRTLPAPALVLIDMAFRDIQSACSLPMSVRALWEHTSIILFTDEAEVDRLRLETQFLDFITLPVSLPVLDMRFRFCRMRVSDRLSAADVIEIAGVSLNTSTREVNVNRRVISLTYKEFELLRYFFTRPRRAFTRDELLAAVWETDNYGDTRTVDMHIQRLRTKLGTRVGNMIHTIRNVGYRFG
ncbi:MAG: response regulator transcription factor [bacterium]